MDTRQQDTMRVWDLPTRLFHWVLVVAVAIATLTGYVSPEWWMGVHLWAGYVIVLLLVFRLVWGVFGSEYSRLTSFAHAPRQLGEHLRGLFLLRPPHYLGHNPTGAVMIAALMVVLTGLTVSGLIVLGGEEKQGPLAGVVYYVTGNTAKIVHSTLVDILLVMIAGHIIGAIVESLLMRENLIAAMITGRKRLPVGMTVPRPRRARPIAALCSVGGFAVISGGVLAYLGTLPPTGWRPLTLPVVFTKECGACHWTYHPSLLPASSWRTLMQGLSDHFGEDASLDEEATAEITAFLLTNAAETWDTEAANRFRTVAANDPWRISATPYWVRKHQMIPETVFVRQGIGGKSNCIACHRDADSGRFDDQMIMIPKG
jgi:cytochrome b